MQEEELEREKQQQLVLLQELEDQKAKLEQLLREAQQEREHLKAQKLPVNQPEAPGHDQEVTSGLSTVVNQLLMLFSIGLEAGLGNFILLFETFYVN